jgi:hypothetical protein
MKKEKELSQQEAEHLRMQVDELSRLQHPREFRLVPPTTIPFDRRFLNDMGEKGLNQKKVGWDVVDRNQHVDAVVERAIGRWKGIVKEAREGAGMAGQRTLSGESAPASAASASRPIITTNTATNNNNSNPNNMNMNMNMNHTTNGTDAIGSDQDADADADMEEDDSYVEMTDAPSQRAPEAPMVGAANFRLMNGNPSGQQGGGSTVRMEGMENQTIVQGYVRIGA